MRKKKREMVNKFQVKEVWKRWELKGKSPRVGPKILIKNNNLIIISE